MALDENLPALLERAAGSDPGTADPNDVRRRARRYVRRRRATVAAAAALALPGLFVTERLQADHGAQAAAEALSVAGQPGRPLFERQLADGSLLRVTTGDDPDEIAVEWPGSPVPVTLRLGLGSTSSTGTEDEWTIVALRPCPGDQARHLHAFQTADPSLSDEMELVDGLAVVVVPPLVPPSEAPLPATHHVTIQERDAAGHVVSSVGLEADVVATGDDDALEAPPPDGLDEGTEQQAPRCEPIP